MVILLLVPLVVLVYLLIWIFNLCLLVRMDLDRKLLIDSR